MTTSRFTSPALLHALIVVLLATCGCTSMSGATNKWGTAWKKSTEPKPADPNHEDVVTYWGQKKKGTKLTEMPPELKARLAKKTDEPQHFREYADNFKAGNLRLKEGRLDEARRAYELALAAKPDDPDVHHRLAVVADKQQLFGAADDHYEAALRQRPRDPNLLSDIGYSYSLRGDDRRAEQTLREALALDPSHKGAMLNLGTLYGKQRRYDDALALLKRGTTEAETRQYMAQLFPQGPPLDVAQASNQVEAGPRSARSVTDDAQTDVRNMTVDQLKSEVERRQVEGASNRRAQFAQSPLQRDWMGDSLMQDSRAVQEQRASIPPNSPAGNSGPAAGGPPGNPSQSANTGFGQPWPSSTHPPTGTAMPSGATMFPPSVNLQPGTTMLPYPGPTSNGTVPQPGFAPQPGFVAAPSPGSLAAPPGTSPHSNMDFWPGASVQPNGGASNSFPAQHPIEQMSHTQGGAAGGVSLSQAAAQLGMSAGPGSLFPIVPSDPASVGNMSRQSSVTPAYEQRFHNEFPQPPQYQTPNSQFTPNHPSAPSRAPNQGRVLLLGNDGSAASQYPPNWPGASSSRSNGTAQQVSAGNDVAIAPSSPANNMSSPWDSSANWQPPTSNTGSGVVQAGGLSSWGQSSSPQGDPQNAFQSDKGNGAISRYAKTPWDDPTTQPVGSRPYNGAWPNGNAIPNAAPSSNGSSANSLPPWNGGSGAGASMPSGAGSSSGSTSNSSPQPWPYSPQR